MTPDRHDIRPVDQRIDDLALLEVRGNENVAMEARGRSIGRNRIGQIARGRASDRLESKFHGTTQSNAHHAVLEGQRRIIDRIVLNPQFADPQPSGQTICLDEWSIPHLSSHRWFAGNREQFPIPPHVLGTRANLIAGETLADALVVISHFQRSKIELANMCGPQGVFSTALPALQCLHESVALAHKKNNRRGNRSAHIQKTDAVGNKNPFRKARRGLLGRRRFSSSPELCSSDRIWHLAVEHVSSTGCRGFIGPSPLPLWMSATVTCSKGS